MSGGSYDYAYRRVEEAATQMRSYHRDRPHVIAFADHLMQVADAMRDIEWADSCDTSWDDALDEKIRATMRKDAPLKEATAQAIAARDALTRELALCTPDEEGGNGR